MIKGYMLNSCYVPTEKIYIDTVADLPDLEKYADEKGLVMGSECLCIATGKRYILNSSGAWVEQP